MRKNKTVITVVKYVLLAMVIFFTIFPFYWLAVSAFKPKEELFTRIPSLLIKNPTFKNIIWTFGSSSGDLLPFFANSVIITLFTIIITISLSYLAAYAIARHKFPGITIVLGLLIFSQMFQGPSIMVAWYKMAQALGIINTRLVLVLIYCTSTIPISTFLLSGFIRSIPRELEEAAMIDGASKAQTLSTIIFPLLRPFLVSVAIYSAIIAWNDYQYAMILTTSKLATTVQVALANLMDSMGSQNWGGIMATALVITVPIVIFFSIVQKNLIAGLTQGSVKG